MSPPGSRIARVLPPSGEPPAAARRWAVAELDRAGIDQAEATAELALRHVLGCDRVELALRTEPLSARERADLRAAIERRIAGEPIQHVVGTQAFRSLELEVRPGVFVPRPETELLVEHALEMVAATRRPLVVDVGTGTGAIALAVAAERRDATVVATDRSHRAVELARANAARLGLAIDVRLGDLLDPIEPTEAVDLIVSNPPYLRADGVDLLPDEVAADPPGALFAPADPFGAVIEQAATRLPRGGGLALEIGEEQGADVAAALAREFREVRVLHDLTGRDRFATGRRR